MLGNAMELRSLGFRTDLIFPGFDGEILDRGDYLVVRTPTNPTYFYGNFLIFRDPPEPGDLPRWKALFDVEIGSKLPDPQHYCFGWDSPEGVEGEIGPFLAEGFELETTVIMTASSVRKPPKFCAEAEVRPLSGDAEWAAALAGQIEGRDPEFSLEDYTVYKTDQMARYRRMSEAGLGHWFGAFLDGRLAADLGLFRSGSLGRFQMVGTRPEFRRRGVCGALVYGAARHGFDRMGLGTLVMAADPEYHAARIYESAGFAPRERAPSLLWWRRPSDRDKGQEGS